MRFYLARADRTFGPRRFVAAVAAAVILASTPAFASRSYGPSGVSSLTAARLELHRIQVRLLRAAESDPAVIAARDAARRACAALYQARQNALAGVHASEEYADLRLALWAKQRQISGIHDEIPVRVQALVSSAKDAMELRGKLGAMERAALDANEAYVEARADADQRLSEHLQAQRESTESIRGNAEYVAALTRVQSMQQAITGKRSTLVSR